jgi:hypothetical protein
VNLALRLIPALLLLPGPGAGQDTFTPIASAPGWDAAAVERAVTSEPGNVLAVEHAGQLWLLGWSTARVADSTSTEQTVLVAGTKAQAEVAAFLRTEITEDTTVSTTKVAVTANGEHQTTLETYRATIISEHAQGILGPLVPVASWTSGDGSRVVAVMGVEVPGIRPAPPSGTNP